jgi:pyruvate ferredoxin oxidoreductase alpha subunit
MQILEGSRAVAYTIKNIGPEVISAYPITPQTHIVEDLAQFKADGKADYEYVRAESEFAAASIIEGASATGSRVYSATSSQGLLLMTEVIYNIAGMRLPAVITCANRGISAPITIWNDHQDAMSVRDAGWIMFFAENHQESVRQHIIAYKVAEKLRLPALVNIDGYILTHSYEPVNIPTVKQIKKFLPAKKNEKNEVLDPENPVTLGAFASPAYYMELREQLHQDLLSATAEIKTQYEQYRQKIGLEEEKEKTKYKSEDNGLVEYYGPAKPQTILVSMGSVTGTVKEVVDEQKNVGVLKIKVYRPFPDEEISRILKKAKYVAVLDKAIGLGNEGPLAGDVRSLKAGKNLKAKIQNFIVGLGGRDITREMIRNIIKQTKNQNDKTKFIGK